MIEYLMNLDTEVFLFLHSGQNAFWDIAMKMASGRLIWAGMYLVMIYAMLRTFGWRTTVVMTLMAIVAVGAATRYARVCCVRYLSVFVHQILTIHFLRW